jgi:hypothetical protein
MTRTLSQVECPPGRGFFVRSHDPERELIDIVISHAKNIHGAADCTERHWRPSRPCAPGPPGRDVWSQSSRVTPPTHSDAFLISRWKIPGSCAG